MSDSETTHSSRVPHGVRSLKRGFMLVAAPLIVSVIVVFFGIVEYLNFSRSLDGLSNKLKNIADSQVILLAEPIARGFEDQIVVILAPILADPDLVSTTVENSRLHLEVFGEPLEGLNSQYVLRRDITYFDDAGLAVVGTLVIGATTQRLVDIAWERLGLALILAAMLVGAVTFSITVSLRRTVITPITILLRSINEVGTGVALREVAWSRDDEIGRLIDAFNAAQKRQSYYEHRLRTAHDEMQLLANAAADASRAKSEFLSRMSHEIRTPLNGLLGMNEVLTKTELSPRQRRCTEMISRSAQVLLRVIGDVLDFSKIEAGKLELRSEVICADELLDDMEMLFAETTRSKGLDLVCLKMPAVAGTFYADSGRLRQILINLIGNAVKFTDHGEVRVEIVVDTETAVSALLVISVSDTGIGLSDDEQEKIFRPFVQADKGAARGTEGTGLGLAICSQLATLMGGTLSVTSVLGQGSTFTCCVPVKRVVVDHRTSSRTAGLAKITSQSEAKINDIDIQGRILLAEDNPINQELALEFLDIDGVEVILVNNGRDALEAWTASVFSLILMDCNMPELNGWEATQAIREAEHVSGRARTPIVAMTANAFVENKDYAIAVGMDDYLSKPFSESQLRMILSRWLPRKNKNIFQVG